MVKNLPADAGDTGSIPGSRRSPGGGNGKPLQYSCLENPMDRGAWRAVVHGITEESDTTEWARILSCQLFQLLLSSPTLYLILASLEGLESPGSNQSTCLPTPFPGRIPKVRPLSHNFLGPFPFCSLPENLGSWHSSLLGLQVILETMPLFVGRWY